MSYYYDAFRQCFFLPAPTFTEKELPDQTGRVLIVTGGYAGVGKELCKMLYQKNGTVYLAGRSEDKAKAAISEIKQSITSSDGRLEFLKVDLADLPSIKGSVQEFMRREQRLDVLTNNAGVMAPPVGTKSAQNYEVQMGTNCLGPFLLTKLLTPLLEKTASTSAPGSVRVTWAASLATAAAPKGGVQFDASGGPRVHNDRFADYAQTKASNCLLASEYQSRYGGKGRIVSNSWNPGNLMSELQRHQQGFEAWFTKLLCYPPHFGGYTELFAGWSEEAGKPEHRGKYVGPWGRFVMLRSDIEANKEGAKKFWEWCEQETKPYA
ncbi:short-chain alcohol dehydrogenase [Recurvomyces mirabilis]|uniref:Short-chain alcohol dehydrogenase n=1 Tax=Recurvomyces mirabilis TaxID=574656 RepID=A0AAE0TPV7_9PEZI|nr:short-chain alcohol dehydrogenase [Recurvomyces mirabilis]KAK5156259.1 short-chain alcohol dehydrogenase [Recurvomyces mirabilis]